MISMPWLPPTVAGFQRLSQHYLGNGMLPQRTFENIIDAVILFLHDAVALAETTADKIHDINYSSGFVTFDFSTIFLATGKYPDDIDALFFVTLELIVPFCRCRITK